MADSFCEVFMLIGDLAYHRGARSIKDVPGLHDVPIDALWCAKINPHREEVDGVPGLSMAIEFNGFPAGLFMAHGGVVAAGSVANEGALCAALRKAIEAENKGAGRVDA